GKSTLLKSIIGLLHPAAGSIVFAGEEIAGHPTHRISRRGLGYVPEERRIFTGLSVAENLAVGRRPPGGSGAGWTAERIYELFPPLSAMRRRRGGAMSGGEQQMLAIARTLMGNPRMILLDEPSQGLAPRVVTALANALEGLKRQGMTVLLSEQNVRFAERLADRATVLETGQVRWVGTMAAFAADIEAQHDLLHV
ncbi:MAG: ABC transporter ATP-binding protein, partial [Anaerolineae bacterium]|nr:ABC transporter ATP-binding protein [Anaerolineae bacterium]